MLTMVWPLLVVWTGVLALTQVVTALATPVALSPLSGIRPPEPRPLGTLGSCKPGWLGSAPRLFGPAAAKVRAAFCAASIARTAWVARLIEFCDCAAIAAACCAVAIAEVAAMVGAATTAPERPGWSAAAWCGQGSTHPSASALFPASNGE